MSVLETVCEKEKIDIKIPYKNLTEKERKKILYGVPGTFIIPYITKYNE
jgi:excinuclease UvrABC ATPase subunit